MSTQESVDPYIENMARALFYFGVTVTLSLIILIQILSADVGSQDWWDKGLTYATMLGLSGMVAGTAVLCMELGWSAISSIRCIRGEGQ